MEGNYHEIPIYKEKVHFLECSYIWVLDMFLSGPRVIVTGARGEACSNYRMRWDES